MASEARYRDRVSFGSDSNHARALGVSRQTIRRWKCQLEADGAITRDGYHRWGPRCKTVRYRICVRVTQRTSCQSQKSSRAGFRRTNAYRRTCSGRAASAPQGRRRRLMEKHPEKIEEGVVRRSGEITPFNAGDAVAALCDMYRGPIPTSWRARLGKAAKELLADGFDANTVVASLLTSVRMARPDLAVTFAVELHNARTGQSTSWSEYRRALGKVERATNPALQRIYDTLRKEFEK